MLQRALLVIFCGWVLGVCTGVKATVAVPVPSSIARPFLIEYSWGGHDAPAYVQAHREFVQTRPFDGMLVEPTGAVEYLMYPYDGIRGGDRFWTYATISSQYAPIESRTFATFAHNYTHALMSGWTPRGKPVQPRDLFDDQGWYWIARSSENFARVTHDRGFEGIMLDDEIYTYHYWRYPRDVQHKNYSLQQYVDEAELRGRQVMAAFVRGYPGIRVVVLHGPDEACSKTKAIGQSGRGDSHLLFGGFFAGMVLGASGDAVVEDGGEEGYFFRTPDEFRRSYEWRRTGLLSSGCPFLNPAVIAAWPRHVTIGFGIYDKPYVGLPMNAKITTVVVTDALHTADPGAIVWHYSEARDWWVAPGDPYTIEPVTENWIDAIQQARQDDLWAALEAFDHQRRP